MIDAKRLLSDLKRLRRQLEADLRERHGRGSAGWAAVEVEWREAHGARRTADGWDAFLSAAVDQAAVHWILGACFLRFLEDNGLVERPLLSGPGERGELARQRQDAWFRARPHLGETEYLLALVEEAAALPGMAGLFDPRHNPLFRLPLSGDGARALIGFFRATDAGTGGLLHLFADGGWGAPGGTRWLGDLYQDLSEEARKRYALLQTPEFVEGWILDRTLLPAMGEFGHAEVRLLDPACGSGHFLLGSFARLLDAWRRAEPGLPPAALAQYALDGVAGVDLNPFAVEVARFRLLVAALHAAGETRLSAAPGFRFKLAVGDSLLHGRHFGAQRSLGEGAERGWERRQRHGYAAEDRAAADRLLGEQYHAVVGNPPYITPKDPAMREAYREIYQGCHMKYALGVPFIERFFDLAQRGEQRGTGDQAAGYVGLIVANSFMKREFGSKLIEQVLPRLDLTHVVDCSGVPIPGHGTPTAILFGRNQPPVQGVVRTVRAMQGKLGIREDPSTAPAWTEIVAQTDHAAVVGRYVSTEDTLRAALASHPWNMGGGGAAELQEVIEEGRAVLEVETHQIGFGAVTGADEVFAFGWSHDLLRSLGNPGRPFIIGENVRDYRLDQVLASVWLYDTEFLPVPPVKGSPTFRHLWPHRTVLSNRKLYGEPILEAGLNWYEYGEVNPGKQRIPLTITFGEVATHNHFVLDRGGKVFNRTAPVIKLPEGTGEEEHLGLLGLLNSSVACFWLKQVCHNKGATVDDRGARQRTDPFEDFYQFNGTRVGQLPVAEGRPVDLARALDDAAQRLSANLPSAVARAGTPTRAALDQARAEADAARGGMVALQEELDWRCYRLYGLLDQAPEHPDPPPLRPGQRAFEVVMARQVAAGELDGAWFARHRSVPLTELPAEWPAEYRAAVERRIALVQEDPRIGLLERPEHKRRWASAAWNTPWEEQERDALRAWLADRLEGRRFWPEGAPAVLSARQLADLARGDAPFVAVAGLLGAEGADLDALVAGLAMGDGVPFLAALRYSDTGLRKRAEWEAAWEKQRQEDRIDAEVEAMRDHYEAQARERLERGRAASKDGAVPPLPLAGSGRGADRRRGEGGHARGNGAGVDSLTLPTPSGAGPFPLPQAVEGEVVASANRLIAAEQARRKLAEVGRIPVPPKYRTPDFLSAGIWRLRGGLDVPKERFVTFPHCARDEDGSMPLLWAGYDHLDRARATAALYLERKDRDGWLPARLAPLLAGVAELLPWLRQWHDGYDPATGFRMGEYFTGFVQEEAQAMGMTEAELRAWRPSAPARRPRARRAA